MLSLQNTFFFLVGYTCNNSISLIQAKYKEVKARNAQLLKMMHEGESK